MVSENIRTLRIIATFLGFIAAFLVVVILKELRSIMLPLSVAILLSYILGPFVEKLTRRKVPMALAMVMVLIAVFVLLYLVGVVVYASSNTFIEEFPKYEARVKLMITDLLTYLDIPVPQAREYISQLDWKQALAGLSLPKIISSTLGSLFGFLGNAAMVILISMFIIPGMNKIGAKFHRMFGKDRGEMMESMLDKVNAQVQQYLYIKTLVSLGTGLLFTVFLWIFGVDFPIMWGFIAFVLNYIPTFGSIIATIPPILVCFVEYGPGMRLLTVGILLIAVQVVMGNFVEPKIMGRSLNLSPLIVILSLIFWGWLWGIPGMILAVPITAALKLACENVGPLKPIAILMEGRVGGE
jgi:AI-2 transport protein TqsA